VRRQQLDEQPVSLLPQRKFQRNRRKQRPRQAFQHPRTTTVVWLFDSKNLPAVGPANFVHTNLHTRGAQFTFLDGHVSRFRSFEYWDFAIDKGRTNNPSLVWDPRAD